MAEKPNPNRARDHLANERTFLAWVRTGAAVDRAAGASRTHRRHVGLDGLHDDCRGAGPGGRGLGALPKNARAVGCGYI